MLFKSRVEAPQPCPCPAGLRGAFFLANIGGGSVKERQGDSTHSNGSETLDACPSLRRLRLAMSDLTIFDAVTECRRIFRTATTVPRLMRREWEENRLADFNIWSKGSGASTTGRSSLDYRLHDNPKARTILINLLLMLRILIEKCVDGGMDTCQPPD